MTLIWTDPKVVGVFRARLTGRVLVRGARSKYNRLQPGEGAAELLRLGPAFRKMQGQPACRAGEPSGDREEPPPEGLGGHHLLAQTDARCPAGQVCAITWTASQAALAAKRQGCGIGIPWASWRIPAWADSHNDPCVKQGRAQQDQTDSFVWRIIEEVFDVGCATAVFWNNVVNGQIAELEG